MPTRTPKLISINKKKIVDFDIPADPRVKIKAGEKLENYFDFPTELKMLWSMEVIVIPIIAGNLEQVPKNLKKGFWDLKIWVRIKTISITTLLKSIH